jgi:hypothetical protein
MSRIRKSVVAFALASISVTPAAFGQAIGAATDNAPSPSAANRLPRTLFISASRGGTVRLIYVPDDGWSFADGAIGSKATMAALTPTAMSRSDEGSAAEKPLAVFIDGPTGCTYVWIGETGWKFVGRIVDERR